MIKNLFSRGPTVLLLLMLVFGTAYSDTTSDSELPLKYENHSLLLIPALDDAVLDEFYRHGFDVIRVGEDGSLKVVATADESRILQEEFGALVEIDNMEEYYRARLSTDVAFGGYRTFAGIQATLDSFVVNYPDKAMLDTIGYSLEGRPILALKISDNVTVDEDEPEIELNGLHHAREPITYEILINYVRWVLTHQGTDFADSLLNGYETWLIPVVNPDGLVYNEVTNPEGGGMWRKNRQINPDLTYGVDLNRNYGYRWGFNDAGSSTNPSSLIYRGTGPFSELESQAVRDFYNAHDFCISLHFHAFGNFMNLPYNFFFQPVFIDEAQFLSASQYLAALGGCNLPYGGFGTGPNGTSYDWTYGEQASKRKCFSLLVEAGGEFWPPTDQIDVLNARFLPQVQYAVLMAYDVWKTPSRSVGTAFSEFYQDINWCEPDFSDTVWFHNVGDEHDLLFGFEMLEVSGYTGWCSMNATSATLSPGDSMSVVFDYTPSSLSTVPTNTIVSNLVMVFATDQSTSELDTLFFIIHNNVIMSDLDADEIHASCDNCPELYNPDQADWDGDGIGDLCDGCCGLYTAGLTGNTNCSDEGARNLADITLLIDRVYVSKSELCCEPNGNVDGSGDGKINLSDITSLIDHVYVSKEQTAICGET